MSAAAEQSHARVQQDGGYKRRVWDPPQAFDAALKASWRHTWIKKNVSKEIQDKWKFFGGFLFYNQTLVGWQPYMHATAKLDCSFLSKDVADILFSTKNKKSARALHSDL